MRSAASVPPVTHCPGATECRVSRRARRGHAQLGGRTRRRLAPSTIDWAEANDLLEAGPGRGEQICGRAKRRTDDVDFELVRARINSKKRARGPLSHVVARDRGERAALHRWVEEATRNFAKHLRCSTSLGSKREADEVRQVIAPASSSRRPSDLLCPRRIRSAPRFPGRGRQSRLPLGALHCSGRATHDVLRGFHRCAQRTDMVSSLSSSKRIDTQQTRPDLVGHAIEVGRRLTQLLERWRQLCPERPSDVVEDSAHAAHVARHAPQSDRPRSRPRARR